MQRLRTLGTLELEGEAYAQTKALTLLAYLTLEGKQPRRTLAALFWPHAADPLNQLSVTVSRLARSVPGALCATGTHVDARVACDAVDLEAALSASDTSAALGLFAGRFLEGTHVRGASSELVEWVDETRDRLERGLQRALLDRAAVLAREGSGASAARQVRDALAVGDPSLLDVDDVLFAHHVLLLARDPAAHGLRTEAEALGLPLPKSRAEALAHLARSPVEPGMPLEVASAVARADPDGHTDGAAIGLFGRDAELALLRRLMLAEGRRLVTVTGPGGVGKSRLAATVARDPCTREAFAGGVAVVACHEIGSPVDVMRAAFEAFGVPQPPVGPDLGELVETLGGRGRCLLVLDDFDHLVGSADWPRTLVGAATNVTVLVTSSQPLEVLPEWVLPLAGLTSDGERAGAAGELFVERARRADATFELEDADVPYVVELCRLTGGNPLALELAASWTTVMPVSEIVAEVRQGVHLLSSTSHDAPPRHRSVLAVFERGWGLLGAADEERMMRLSVLAGSFDRAAAAAVAGVSVRDLARLCRNSMLGRPESGRFECQPTLRRWVRERLSRAGALGEEVRGRHAAHFLSVALEAQVAFDARNGGRWLERLDVERADLLWAMEWFRDRGDMGRLLRLLNALGQYWIRRGHFDIALPWYERVAALEPLPDVAPDLAACLRTHAYMLLTTGELEEPVRLLRRSLEAADASGLPREQVKSNSMLGVLAVYRLEYGLAEERYQIALSLAQEHGLEEDVARALNNIGDVKLYSGRPDLARHYYEEAVALERSLGNLQMVSNVLGSVGVVAVHEGRLPEAEAALNESLRLVDDLGITFSLTTALEQYAVLLTAAGRPLVAGRLWGAAESLRLGLGTPLERFAAEERDQWLLKATDLAGVDALESARSEGRGLTPAAARDLALREGAEIGRLQTGALPERPSSASGQRSLGTVPS